MRTLQVALWGAVAVAGVAAGGLYVSQAEPEAAALGGDFTLVDHFGEEITEAAFEDGPTLLFFGFTHCPEICPTTVYEMAGWFDELGPAAEGLDAYFVSVDPERDTPEVLEGYLTSQTDDVVGITGEPDAVWQLAADWKAYWQKVELEGGDYTVDHFAGVYMLDEDGEYAGLISYGEPQAQVLPKLRTLLGVEGTT
jgi:protein SCO1/2